MAFTFDDVDTPEWESEFAPSDTLDGVVAGGLEAYSQVPLPYATGYECRERDDSTDTRSILLAAVFFSVQMVLVIETVLAIHFDVVDLDDFVGSLTSGLLALALFLNFGAAFASAWEARSGFR